MTKKVQRQTRSALNVYTNKYKINALGSNNYYFCLNIFFNVFSILFMLYII